MALGVKFNKADYEKDIIVPHHVRYDPYLPYNSKLIYGEILNSPCKNGVYSLDIRIYAKLYHSEKVTIIRWLKGLEDHGYIKTKRVYAEDEFTTITRLIKVLK